ncbi:possible gliding motility-related protein [unidentified eubacterium SCB49]|nr:possible gliding motility-related protein [unidentified eubacterium SCB49]
MRFLIFFLLFTVCVSCEDDVVVKPHAELRLRYPAPKYSDVQMDCPFVFKQNEFAQVLVNKNCGIKVEYPTMNATVFLTYINTDPSKIDRQLYEAQKLALGHKIRAVSIPESQYVNPDKKTYGTFYEINGNAASHGQFYLTDSIKHFVTGALYFKTKPNFDSLLPAIDYVRNDMRMMMETMEWKKSP